MTANTTFASDISLSLAISAHAGTSWQPEKRGAQVQADYAATLENDWKELSEIAEKHGSQDLLPEQFARYREGYRKRVNTWLASSSRCVSSWIAGPSNFPARRMQKRMDVSMQRCSEMLDYRTRALAAIRRALRPAAFISSADGAALEKLEAQIAGLQAEQDKMKSTNATIRKHAKQGEQAQVAALIAMGYSEGTAYTLLKPDFCGRVGYADYQLTNNGANIRRLQGRVVEISHKRTLPEQSIECKCGARVEVSPLENRVRIHFPGKPDAETISDLKRNGSRCAPSQGAWSAYHNATAVRFAQQIVSRGISA